MLQALFQRWRFINQVTLVIIILQLMIFLIIHSLTKTHFSYLSEKIRYTQIELLQFININQNKLLLEIYADSCNHGILRSQLKLFAADRLNHFIQLSNINIPNPQLCLIQPYECTMYDMNQTYTYAFMNTSVNQTPQNNLDYQSMKLSATLTYTRMFSDEDIYLFFTTTSDSLYWSVMPGTIYAEFNPHQRTWSLNNSKEMKNNPNNTFFSDPYISQVFKTYFIAQTKALTNLKYESQGILSTGINFNLFKFYQMNTLSILIIDKYGKLLLQKNDTLNPQYFYNTTITGFNYHDFLNLQTFYQNSSQFTCLVGDIQLSKTLCLNNQLNNQKLMANQKILSQSGFIIIITQDLSQTSQQIFNNLESFDQKIEWIQSSYLKVTFSIAILLVVLSQMLIQLVLKQINQLRTFVNDYLRGGLTSKLRRKVQVLEQTTRIHKSSDQLEKLKHSLLVMHDKTHIAGKCQECLCIENRQEYFQINHNDSCNKQLQIINGIVNSLDQYSQGIISIREIILLLKYRQVTEQGDELYTV